MSPEISGLKATVILREHTIEDLEVYNTSKEILKALNPETERVVILAELANSSERIQRDILLANNGEISYLDAVAGDSATSDGQFLRGEFPVISLNFDGPDESDGEVMTGPKNRPAEQAKEWDILAKELNAEGKELEIVFEDVSDVAHELALIQNSRDQLELDVEKYLREGNYDDMVASQTTIAVELVLEGMIRDENTAKQFVKHIEESEGLIEVFSRFGTYHKLLPELFSRYGFSVEVHADKEMPHVVAVYDKLHSLINRVGSYKSILHKQDILKEVVKEVISEYKAHFLLEMYVDKQTEGRSYVEGVALHAKLLKELSGQPTMENVLSLIGKKQKS